MQKYNEFVMNFEKNLKDIKDGYSNIIFLCIGTNKIIGDSIGPIIGNKLKKMENESLQIYGTMDDRVNFINAKDVIEKIYTIYKKPYIITIDSALSDVRPKGNIAVYKGYIKIGKALSKSICFYSNVNIKCVVGNCYNDVKKNIEELNNVKISDVTSMANIIINGIEKIFNNANIFV